jgi:hypothetical protein
MTTSVQSASSHPTARDLLILLDEIGKKNPRLLDREIGTFDTEYESYDIWHGVLDLDDDVIGISLDMSDAVKAEWAKQRKELDDALAAERELEMQNKAPVDLSDPVQAAREAGLLPPGA